MDPRMQSERTLFDFSVRMGGEVHVSLTRCDILCTVSKLEEDHIGLSEALLVKPSMPRVVQQLVGLI